MFFLGMLYSAKTASVAECTAQDSKNKLATFIGNRKELNNTLRGIYDNEISKDIQKTINSAATKTLITTAISSQL